MTKVTRKDTDVTVVIGECHLEVELGMNKIIENRIMGVDCKIIIEMTLGEESLGRCKVIEVSRIMEVNVETILEFTTEITMIMTIEMIILEEVEVGPGKDNHQVIIGGMIEAAVDQD